MDEWATRTTGALPMATAAPAVEANAALPVHFENPRRAHPATDAHGHEPDSAAAAPELVNELRRELGARRTEWVAEGDGPAVDVQLGLVEAELPRDGQDLGGEGLVELDQVYVAEAHPRTAERLGHGLDRTDPHDVGLDARGAEGHETREDRQPERLCPLAAGQHDRSRAIGVRRSVPGRDRTVCLE